MRAVQLIPESSRQDAHHASVQHESAVALAVRHTPDPIRESGAPARARPATQPVPRFGLVEENAYSVIRIASNEGALVGT